jgi:hypothetical protein
MVSFSVIGGLFRETKLGGGQTRARQAKAGRVAEVKSRGLCQLFEPDRGGPAGSGAISSEASGKGAARQIQTPSAAAIMLLYLFAKTNRQQSQP